MRGTSQALLDRLAALGLLTALLALKYLRLGAKITASGILVFAIGEGVLLSGTAAGPAGSMPAFAAGTALFGWAWAVTRGSA